jgi:hypothetical protein
MVVVDGIVMGHQVRKIPLNCDANHWFAMSF